MLASRKPRHRHQKFLAFLRAIVKAVPAAELNVHCIVDNYATHSHPKVKAWLASRPRWHMHFIPTHSSWLIQVERFFALITDKAIRRSTSTSLKQLVSASNSSSKTTMPTANRSDDLPPQIRSLRSCIDFAHISAGQDTRFLTVQRTRGR